MSENGQWTEYHKNVWRLAIEWTVCWSTTGFGMPHFFWQTYMCCLFVCLCVCAFICGCVCLFFLTFEWDFGWCPPRTTCFGVAKPPGKKKQEKRDPLTAMCAALQKPLFQQLRIIYDQQEAMDLFQVPKSPAHSFQVQLPPEKMVRTYQKLPQKSTSLQLGRVEKEAMEAFIHDLRGLRGEMRQQLAQFLRKSGKVKFKFWLEVKTPQPQKFMILGSQSGEVEATLRARLPVEQLQQALESLDRGQWRQRKRQGSTSWMSPRKVSKSSGGALRKRRLSAMAWRGGNGYEWIHWFSIGWICSHKCKMFINDNRCTGYLRWSIRGPIVPTGHMQVSGGGPLRPAWKLSYSCTEDSNKLSGRRKKTVDGCGAWGSSGWKDQATRQQGLHRPTSNAKHHIRTITDPISFNEL